MLVYAIYEFFHPQNKSLEQSFEGNQHNKSYILLDFRQTLDKYFIYL